MADSATCLYNWIQFKKDLAVSARLRDDLYYSQPQEIDIARSLGAHLPGNGDLRDMDAKLIRSIGTYGGHDNRQERYFANQVITTHDDTKELKIINQSSCLNGELAIVENPFSIVPTRVLGVRPDLYLPITGHWPLVRENCGPFYVIPGEPATCINWHETLTTAFFEKHDMESDKRARYFQTAWSRIMDIKVMVETYLMHLHAVVKTATPTIDTEVYANILEPPLLARSFGKDKNAYLRDHVVYMHCWTNHPRMLKDYTTNSIGQMARPYRGRSEVPLFCKGNLPFYVNDGVFDLGGFTEALMNAGVRRVVWEEYDASPSTAAYMSSPAVKQGAGLTVMPLPELIGKEARSKSLRSWDMMDRVVNPP